MAKYNWEALKAEFLVSDCRSLSEFAKAKGLRRDGNFNKRTGGWVEEKAKREQEKGKAVVTKVTARQVDAEVDRNTLHLHIWDKLLGKASQILDKPLDTKDMASLAAALDKAQKGQRLALGLDQGSGDGEDDPLKELARVVADSKARRDA